MLIRSSAAGERLGGLARSTAAAAEALAVAFDVVVIETVGVGQAETDVAEAADTVVVVVQPGAGDALQFLKSGIMEVPDVLVVTKADLGQLAISARRDLAAALRSLGARSTPVLAISSLPPPSGIEELLDVLEQHRAERGRGGPPHRRPPRAGPARVPRRARRAGAAGASAARPRAERLLAAEDPGAEVPSLIAALERSLAGLSPAHPAGGCRAPRPGAPICSRRAWRPGASSRPGAR